MMKSCKKGYYYCNTDQKCKPIPEGSIVRDDGFLMKETLDKKDKPFIKHLVKKLRGGSKTHAKQADDLEKAMKEESNPRIPRKKGQPANSKKHSDLYTDENPKGTIHGLGFKDVATAKASVSKIRCSSTNNGINRSKKKNERRIYNITFETRDSKECFRFQTRINVS